MGLCFKRITDIFMEPLASISSNFEYSESWSGTISDINYFSSFTGFESPEASITSSFEPSEGW
jgi:hypothetical protein